MKLLLILLIATIFTTVRPLISPGFLPTHDGEYHMIRFFEFEKMLKAGFVFPRWAPGLNSGYGVPLFNFFYPFPNYPGSLFHILGWSLADSFKLSLAIAYLSASILCFLWLKKLFSVRASAIGTITFAYVPYWFVDIYVRGSIGEIFAICFLMLYLACVENNWRLLSSFAIAGIIVSHNVLSILFLPLLVAYSLLRRRQYVFNIILGIGLAVYFWVPALLEREFVVGLNAVNIFNYFPDFYQILVPSWGTGFSGSGVTGNEMSPQIGILPVLIIFLSLFSVLRSKEKSNKQLATFFLSVAFLSFFLMLSISYPIWKTVPLLSYLQYPWRLLSLFFPTVAFLTAYVVSNINKFFVQVLFVFFAILFSYQYTRPAMYLPRSDEYYLTKREFIDGTSSLGNSFSTRWSDWKKERAEEKIEIISGSAQISNATIKPTDYRFSILAETASTIAVNTLYYPGWIVQVDSINVSIDYEKDGTIKFLVPSGNHMVRVYFGETPLRILADFISLLSLFWIIRSAILEKVYEHRNRYHANAQRT